MSVNEGNIAIEGKDSSSNPLDAVPGEMPFDVPYGHPMIIGSIGCSGGTDSQDGIVSSAGAAVINQVQATKE